jgi:tyrosyl-tRNA synthetase
LLEDPLSMYSKLEKTPDSVIKQYFELLTNLPLDQLPENPRECQKSLALEVVRQYHGQEKALQAQETAIGLTQGQKTSTEAVPEFSLAAVNFPAKAFYLVSASGLCKSSSDARRQIQAGGVRLGNEKLTVVDQVFEKPEELYGQVMQFGKNKFVRFVP